MFVPKGPLECSSGLGSHTMSQWGRGKGEGAWEIALALPDSLRPQSLLVFAIALLSFMTPQYEIQQCAAATFRFAGHCLGSVLKRPEFR